MGTKNDPGEYDCYANAYPDEPVFVLRAKDPAAADTIRYWINRRLMLNIPDPSAKLEEASALADEMEAWRRQNPDLAKWAVQAYSGE